MSLEFSLTLCLCHVTASIRNHARNEVACFLECVALKVIHFKCCNLGTETDMKPLLALFDVAMSKLSNDINK